MQIAIVTADSVSALEAAVNDRITEIESDGDSTVSGVAVTLSDRVPVTAVITYGATASDDSTPDDP